MNYKRYGLLVLALCLAFWTAACRRQATTPAPAPDEGPRVRLLNEGSGKQSEDAAKPATDRELLDQVSRRLVAVMDPLPKFVLRPLFDIENRDGPNAYATARIEGEGNDAKVQPRVVVYRGLLEHVIRSEDDPDGDADRLAFIVGHELGHVVLAHIVRPPAGKTEFVQQIFSRQQESAADLKGMELAVKAGYSCRRGRTALERMGELGLTYSSFEGLGEDHPSWSDRLALLDKEQAPLWKAMSAFENGAFFLLVEQYGSAEGCFRAVTNEFPKCPEAWANLGDALLMQYCDALDTADLRSFDVGQMAVGGFYHRPESLETLRRGVNKEQWNEAVAALHKALELKADLLLATANLGVAYLVCPTGQDVETATSYLQDAATRVESDEAMDPLMRAAVLVNAGVADLAGGRTNDSARRFDQAAEVGRAFAGQFSTIPAMRSLSCAMLYNRALLLAASRDAAEQRQAVPHFERYLRINSLASSWWPLAYERYAKLCRHLKAPAKPKGELAEGTPTRYRTLTSVKLKSGAMVTLSEPLADVTARLAEGQAVPVIPDRSLLRLHYPAHGIEILATDRVVAVCLRGPKAPALPVQVVGPGGTTTALHVGMAEQKLDRILRDEDYDLRQFDRPGVRYRFYPRLGLAVRVGKNQIEELVLARIPRRPAPEEK
jgi:tetratricopeptide (TPR) repeat protein